MKFLLLALLPAVAFGQSIPGGISDTTVSASYEPVVFAVKAINDQFAANNGGHSQNLELVQIVSAKTQVVNGQNLYLTLHLTGDYYCDVTVWYRSYLHTADRLQVTSGPTCTKHQPARRQLGGRPLAGGISQPKLVSGSDVPKEVLDALNAAVCSYNDRSNNLFAMNMADMSGVTYTKQVTAGMTYRFYNVPMVETLCHNEGCANLDLTNCAAKDHATTAATCSFTVQSQAWLNLVQLTEFSC